MRSLKQVIYTYTATFAVLNMEVISTNSTTPLVQSQNMTRDDSAWMWAFWASAMSNETEAPVMSDSSSSFSFDASSSSSTEWDADDNNTIQFGKSRDAIRPLLKAGSADGMTDTDPTVDVPIVNPAPVETTKAPASLPETSVPSIAPALTSDSSNSSDFSNSTSGSGRVPEDESKKEEDKNPKEEEEEEEENKTPNKPNNEFHKNQLDGGVSPDNPAGFQESPVIPVTEEEKQQAREASAQAARQISGKQDQTFFVLAGVCGIGGVVALAFVVVHIRRRVASADGDAYLDDLSTDSEDNYHESRSSVYDDPLETRFSSIVMITPNGDGVCVL